MEAPQLCSLRPYWHVGSCKSHLCKLLGLNTLAARIQACRLGYLQQHFVLAIDAISYGDDCVYSLHSRFNAACKLTRKQNSRYASVEIPMYHRSICILSLSLLCLLILKADGDLASTLSPTGQMNSTNRLRVAVCLTGQLLRLEIISKVRHLLAYNIAVLGHQVDLFVLLDNNITAAKQTFWRHDYSNALYKNATTKTLHKFIEKELKFSINSWRNEGFNKFDRVQVTSHSTVRVILEPIGQSNYTIINGIVPVGDKTGPDGFGPTVGEFEPAADRFQNNMRWMGGLRSCVKWVQRTEYEQKYFYDVVVRLRDDSFLLGPWPIEPSKYRGAFVTAAIAPHFGVNDHNFAIDRKWADSVLRGIMEDYYFNETLDMYTWTNTEHRIFKILTSKNIPIRYNDVCEQPVAHLRGCMNSSHWRLHPTYSKHLLHYCGVYRNETVEIEEDGWSYREEEEEVQLTYWQYMIAAVKTAMNWFSSKPASNSKSGRNLLETIDSNTLDTSRHLAGLSGNSNKSNKSDGRSCCPDEWMTALKGGAVAIHPV